MFLIGPALLAYNNAVFTEEDWSGIQATGRSVKNRDPNRIGRFGIGFNSVYHITDLPCIFSGKNVGFMDPQNKYFEDGGCKWSLENEDDQEELEKYSNQFEPLKQTLSVTGSHASWDDVLRDKNFQGTLFRFPLRKELSQISGNLYDQSRVFDLFDSFRTDADMCLLFLRNVAYISLKHIDRDGNVENILTISASQEEVTPGGTDEERLNLLSGAEATSFLKTISSVNPSEEKSCKWLVSTFTSTAGEHDELHKLAEKLNYRPYIGLAFPLDANHNGKFKGRLSCFLPLPDNDTNIIGLPVHVNACFGLTDNRRYIKWVEEDQKHDEAAQWNELLVEKLLPSAYCQIILDAIALTLHEGPSMNPSMVYNLWPDLKSIAHQERWATMVNSMARLLVECRVLCSAHRATDWITAENAVFQELGEDPEIMAAVESFLLSQQKLLVKVPSHVYNMVRSVSECRLTVATPAFIRTILESCNLDSTPRDQKILLLEFILRCEDSKELERIPLLPLSDGSFTSFQASSCGEKVFIDSEDFPRALLPGLEKRFISEDLKPTVRTALQRLASKSKTRFACIVIFHQKHWMTSRNDKHTYGWPEFYSKIVFDNLQSMDTCTRNVFVLHAIDMRNPSIDEMLKAKPCIPSCKRGELQYIKNLIHPKGKIALLYDEEDGRIPTGSEGNFLDPERLTRLETLGMIKDNASVSQLLERAQTVKCLWQKNKAKAYKRAQNILALLNNVKMNNADQQMIQDIVFLPALPPFSPAKNVCLRKPKELYSHKHLSQTASMEHQNSATPILTLTRNEFCNYDVADNIPFRHLQNNSVSRLERLNGKCRKIIDINTFAIKEIRSEVPNSKKMSQYFLVHSCFGVGKALQMVCDARQSVLALPLGSVAVPLIKSQEAPEKWRPDTEAAAGQVFCFLPLSIHSGLPVHINGSFSVTSNRKNLWTTGLKGDWNEALLQDTVNVAYITMLLQLQKMCQEGKIEDYDYYTFWPNMEKVLKPFTATAKAFYEAVAKGFQGHPLNLLCNGSDWCAIDNARFLDSKIINTEKIGKTASKEFADRLKRPLQAVVLPDWVRKGFTANGYGDIIDKHTYGWPEFYSKIVFDNLQSMDTCTRNVFVLHAIDMRNPSIDEMLKAKPCIPSCKRGELQYIKNLIHPKGKIALLYDEEDGRIPTGSEGNFLDPERLTRLETLGMIKDNASVSQLLERAQTVKCLWQKNKAKAYKRAQNILALLNNVKMNNADQQMIQDIVFLPALPPFSPAKNVCLRKPKELYSHKHKRLVNMIQPILAKMKFESDFRMSSNVISILGLDKDPSLETVIMQLKKASDCCHEIQPTEINIIVEKCYSYLNKYLKKPNSSSEILARDLKFNCIFVEGRFVAIDKVARQVSFDATPYLYKLPSEYTKYDHLWRCIGIKKSFSHLDYTSVLQQISEIYKGKSLNKSDLDLSLRVITTGFGELPEEEDTDSYEVQNILLPDTKGVLRPGNKLHYNDTPWLVLNENKALCHKHINREVALRLKVQTTKHKALADMTVDPLSRWMKPFGAHEELTARLSNIIKAYPSKKDILKELIQNADDAKATEIHFIWDQWQKNKAKAYKRAQNILALLNNVKMNNADQQMIQDIVFLPALPPFSPVKNVCLRKPKELYSHKHKRLVNMIQPILAKMKFESDFRMSSNVISILGLDKDPSLETVILQLKKASDCCHEIQPTEINIIVEKCYSYLNKYLKKPNSSSEILARDLKFNCIFVEGRFVAIDKVARQVSFDATPYLYKLPSEYTKYDHLWRCIGIKKSFSHLDYTSVLQQISEIYKGKSLNKSDLDLSLRVITTGFGELPEEEDTDSYEVQNILLPDTKGVLRPVSKLHYNDTPWLVLNENKALCHKHINREVALRLKVQTTKHKALADMTVDPLSRWMKPFGAHEELTARLSNIIKAYPSKKDILKELIQNADDAKATEIHFIWDQRDHPTEKTFGKQWIPLQGPALCVYNNKRFAEKDFEGIQRLGEGGKGNDPEKTGKYGLGFNSVYHLTDCPSFVSGDSRLCVFDPNVAYLQTATHRDPGGEIAINNEFKTTFPDVYETYLPSFYDLDKGTLFRIPLRTSEMAANSKIANARAVNDDDINSLIDVLREDSASLILFLNNIQNITFQKLGKETNKLETLFTVEIKMSEESMKKRQDFQEKVQKIADLKTEVADIEPYKTVYEIEIHCKEKRPTQWILAKQVGIQEEKICASMQELELDQMLLPQGAIAASLSFNIEGKAFCSLPLPVETGLPVHVNGNFAVDFARRDLWKQDGPSVKSEWNEYLKIHVIAPLYGDLLSYIIEDLFKQNDMTSRFKNKEICNEDLEPFLRLFPSIFEIHPQWQDTVHQVYRSIHVRKQELIPVFLWENTHYKQTDLDPIKILTVSWSSVGKQKCTEEPHFMTETYTEDEVMALQSMEMKLVFPFKNLERILEGFQRAGTNVTSLNPESLRKFLMAHPLLNQNDSLSLHINQSPMKKESQLQFLLDYCLKDVKKENINCVEGLPLLLTHDDIVRRFQLEAPKYTTQFHDLFPELNHLFSKSENSIMDALKEAGFLKDFTIADSAQFIREKLAQEVSDDDCCAWPVLEKKNEDWMKRLWKYFNSMFVITDSSKQNNMAEFNELKFHFGDLGILPVSNPRQHQHKLKYNFRDAS
ncbi:UNVERIFIED_CONTAM: hypothetical protein FKN15_004069 [Acipenser sinensis]